MRSVGVLVRPVIPRAGTWRSNIAGRRVNTIDCRYLQPISSAVRSLSLSQWLVMVLPRPLRLQPPAFLLSSSAVAIRFQGVNPSYPDHDLQLRELQEGGAAIGRKINI